jgi:hypothetical protein
MIKENTKILRSTNNQRAHKNKQNANMHTNKIKWLKGDTLPKVGMPHPRGS